MLDNKELLKRFENYCLNDFNQLSENSVRIYVRHCNKMDKLVGIPFLNMKQSDIMSYLNNVKCDDGSVMNIDTKQTYLASIKRLFDFLYTTDDEEIVVDRYFINNGIAFPKQNPVQGIGAINASKKAKLERNERKDGMTQTEANNFLAYLEMKANNPTRCPENAKRDYAQIRLAIELGLRVSDIAELKVNNFDMKNKMLRFYVKKSVKYHELPLSDKLINALHDYWKSRKVKSDYAFTSSTGKSMTTRAMNSSLYTAVKNSKVIDRHISYHTLRHTCGSILYQKTKDMEFVREWLCHSSINTTQRYIVNADVIGNNKEIVNTMLA